MTDSTKRQVIVIGGGGHAKVVIDVLRRLAPEIGGIVDSVLPAGSIGPLGVRVIGNDAMAKRMKNASVLLANGIGSVGDTAQRRKVFETYKALGFGFATIVHPDAVIAEDVDLGEGAQVMAGAVIQPSSRIGQNAIINTRASVDHDCLIGDHVHVAPGVTLSGGVEIGAGTHVGTGASVIQSRRIGRNCVIGAGTVVRRDLEDGAVVRQACRVAYGS